MAVARDDKYQRVYPLEHNQFSHLAFSLVILFIIFHVIEFVPFKDTFTKAHSEHGSTADKESVVNATRDY
jgi:hypothetical protein